MSMSLRWLPIPVTIGLITITIGCRHHEASLTTEPQAWWPMDEAEVSDSVRQEIYELAETYAPYDSVTQGRTLLENDSLYTVYVTHRSKTKYGDSYGVVFAKHGLRFKIVFEGQ